MFDLKEIRRGFLESFPVMVSVFAFGLVYGVLAIKSTLTLTETVLSCIIVLAGMAQFASLPLFAAGASPWVIIGTTFIINMRHFIMGASLSTYLKKKDLFPKLVASHLLIDESFAMATAYAEKNKVKDDSIRDYMIGSGIAVTVAWLVGTYLGAVFGNFLGNPMSLGLDFAVAAAFMGLLSPQIKGKVEFLVMLVALISAVVFYLVLPGSWYILITAIFASLLGALLTKDEN
jgi:4-azaleucine resistance transporter AzlC